LVVSRLSEPGAFCAKQSAIRKKQTIKEYIFAIGSPWA
jgi:hypothetical protein